MKNVFLMKFSNEWTILKNIEIYTQSNHKVVKELINTLWMCVSIPDLNNL